MTKELQYRHELKYEITYFEYMILRQRLKNMMDMDHHVQPDGTYKISSLYWDNFRDKALHEKLEGLAVREKFRIRYYNDNFSYIMLEKKSKENRLYLKESCPISYHECQRLLDGDYEWMINSPHPLMNEFYRKIVQLMLRPKTCVTYEREPYVYQPGNVRITFDRNIRSGIHSTDFLNPELISISATTDKNVIMEVKYDNFLPGMLQAAIQTGNSRVQAFSKYAACRSFEY